MPLGRLPTSMVAFYNGHKVTATTETLDVRVTPVYDQAGRTVIYSVYMITLHEILQASVGGLTIVPTASQLLTAAVVSTAVAQLTRPGGVLKYQGRGFGDLNINTGPKSDVVWGPKPRLVSLKPHGGLTVELTWQVEVAIPNCSDAVFKLAPMEFCYRLSFEKDRQGYTTRTYSGFVRIPQTRTNVSARGLTDSADNYLDAIYPPLLTGFRRIPGTWTLSEDKCRGDFTIVDEQMPPNAPPLGVIECHASHTYQSSSLAHWVSTVSATYDIARGADVNYAIVAFLALLNKRNADAGKMVIGNGLNIGQVPTELKPTVGRPVTLVPISASATEPDIYGRTQVALSVTYAISGVGFTEIFSRGGLWQPVGVGAGGKWSDWVASPAVPTALSSRGHARLVFRPNDDAIVDLCGRAGVGTGGTNALPAPTYPPVSIGVLLYTSLLNAFPVPAAANSWLYYRTRVTVHPDLGRLPVTTLPTAPIDGGANPQAAWDVYGPVPTADGNPTPFPGVGNLFSGQSSQSGTRGGTVVQQRTNPSFYVTVSGQALRAGYQIPMPEVVTINGRQPTLVGRPYFTQGIVESDFVPVVRADWSMTYLFTDNAGGAPSAPVPCPPSSLLS